ncbi:MAG: glycerophosphodiester phosphodiesterase [Deltaproteobacteria bacterium]|nr:glycerophosphodiester phosphodiesterase [Deltaproteobacteria bacterium]
MDESGGDEAPLRPRQPLIAAHRGGAGLWPENALSAFAKAVELGADLIELDVHSSADGVPVVIHDPTLKRTTTGRGRVSSWLEAELSELRLLGKKKRPLEEGIPTLAQVLEVVRESKIGLLIELKRERKRRYHGLEAAVVDILREKQLLPRATIMSFDRESARLVAALTPTARAGLLFRRPAGPIRGIEAIKRLAKELPEEGILFMGLNHGGLDRKCVDVLGASRVSFGAWTVNRPRRMRKLMKLGVDVIITDRPDRALETRTEITRQPVTETPAVLRATESPTTPRLMRAESKEKPNGKSGTDP